MSDLSTPVRIAQVGYGYWGPNLARNFYQLPGAELTYLVDANPDVLDKARRLYACQTTTALADVLNDAAIDAVVIATPARTHYELTKTSLLAGKHVLVEKPLAMSVTEGRDLVTLAAARNLRLMVGHVFEYNPGGALYPIGNPGR